MRYVSSNLKDKTSYLHVIPKNIQTEKLGTKSENFHVTIIVIWKAFYRQVQSNQSVNLHVQYMHM